MKIQLTKTAKQELKAINKRIDDAGWKIEDVCESHEDISSEMLKDVEFTLEDMMYAYEEGERKVEEMNNGTENYKTLDELIDWIKRGKPEE